MLALGEAKTFHFTVKVDVLMFERDDDLESKRKT